MQWTATFGALMSLPPVTQEPGAITLQPREPGNLGTAPQTWTTEVRAPGQTQVKWFVGVPNSKIIDHARTTANQSVVNYLRGDTINFIDYGSDFVLSRVGTTGNLFRAEGSLGFSQVTIANETNVSDIRYTVDGTGGNSNSVYTLLNLNSGIGTITATFTRAGDAVIVKSLDETQGDTSGTVVFSGAVVRQISLTPQNPGDLGTAPQAWTTTANVVGLTQIKWAVFDSNFNSSMVWQVVDVVNGTVSITATFTAVGDRLVVKSIDDTTEVASGQVAFNTIVKSISLSPNSPGDLGTAPKNWTTTATATGLAQIKWAVFDANFNSSMTWQVVNVTNNTASITCNFTKVGERLIVKSIDDLVEAVSTQVAFNNVIVTPPPGEVTDAQFIQQFFQDLTTGPNLEREAGAGRSVAYFTKIKTDSNSTWVRLFTPTKKSWGLFSDAALKPYIDSAANAISAGLKVHLDFSDVVEPADVYSDPSTGQTPDPTVVAFFSRVGTLLAARNFDKRKIIFGTVQEWAYKTNAFYAPARRAFTAALRAKLPGFILVENSADWGNPNTLTNGTFVKSTDPLVCYQWHLYDPNAELVSAATSIGNKVKTWADNNGVTAFCGEWGKYEPIADNLAVSQLPQIINAICRGAGHQRPLIWTITNGTWFRMNAAGTLDLKSTVAAALKAGDAFIRTQTYFEEPTVTPDPDPVVVDPPPATGGRITTVDVLHRGQSNGYYADQYGGPNRLRETLASLAGITVTMISRRETTNNTLHSGTFTYWKSPSNNDPRWLNVPNNDYTTAPSTWTNNYPMTQTIAAVTTYANSDADVPLIDLVLHWEYDLAMDASAARAAYAEGVLEPGRRIRAANPKNAGRYIRAIAYCPYQGGNWSALNTINAAWGAHTADATKNSVFACGNMMDGEPNTQYVAPPGDFSHWGDQSAPRIYPRIAFNLARILWSRGLLPTAINLSDCPSMGPRISSASRDGSNSINLSITHDKGNALVSGIDGISWGGFTYTSNGGAHVTATGGAIVNATTIRVDFAAAIPSTSTERVFYCYNPNFRRKQLVRDNWHSIRPTKYANVPNIAVVEFPLQRTNSGVTF